jgi:hypothetical protein
MDVSGDETMPRNLKANALPTEGYGMEVDGKIKSQHATAEEATKAATALKQKYPYLQVKVFDVKDGTRTEVQLAAPSEGG